jgi:transcriptional regulator with XRE-family HTH domain
VGKAQLERLGRVIREQRTHAEMSLRDLARRTNVSNPYLSQLERGLHEPSVRVLKAIATALNMSAEALMVQAGMLDGPAHGETVPTVVDAVHADDRLTEDQKLALLAVYRSYVEANAAAGDATSRPAEGGPGGSGAQEERV